MEKALTFNQLAPYLPFGIRGVSKDENLGIELVKGYSTYGMNNNINLTTNIDDIDIECFMPILRPLSDYTDITSKAMSDLNCDLTNQMDIQEFALKKMSLSSLLYSSFEVLTRNHVDIFGLIPEGLAIDINTL